MNSFEKVERMTNCILPKDRSEIPIHAQYITFPAHYAGYTQKEVFYDVERDLASIDAVEHDLGHTDVTYPSTPGDACFSEGVECLRPGYELEDEDTTYQFVEKCHMEDDDYQKIIDGGWMPWYMQYMMSIQHPPYTSPQQLGERFGLMGQRCGMMAQGLAQRDIVPIYASGAMPPFDMFSLIRSFEDFVMDLFDEPELVKATIDRATPEIIGSTLAQVKDVPFKRIGLFAMRSDCDTCSPDLFDEFSWPSLKQIIIAFHEAGFKTVLHADSNWLPILDRFLQLPKSCVHFELDGKTDLFKAAQILDGWHSFRGNVEATMFAFGTPDDVSEYCEKLITEIGLKTPGFMLGSGCEVPFNTKPENLKAMLDAVKK